MQNGKLNLAVGAIGILLSSAGGLMLGMTYNGLFAEGHYAIDISRAFLKAAHSHGMPVAMYNLIYALLIGKITLSDRSRKIASWAAALSMIFPAGMILRGLTGGAMTFAPVVMIGVVSFLVSVVYLLVGCRK